MMTSEIARSANEWLHSLVSYVPGKPIEDVARELGLDPEHIVKLASNENPLGPSPKALAAMQAALQKAHFYPDGGGYKLRTAIAQKFGLEIENVVLGNGSNEIIEFLGHAFLRPGSEIITAKHAFSVYRIMAHLFGAQTIGVPDPKFTADVDAMAQAVGPETKLIYLANPNNPTGTMVDQAALDRLISKIPQSVVLALDEAYYEFLENPPDTLRYVRECPNAVLLRTFSKIQGLAGLRIGYGLAQPELIRILQKTRQPFNANAIAQAGAIAGLEDDEYQAKTRAIVSEGRRFLEAAFTERQLEFVPSSANFVLVNVGDAKALFERLLRRGTIIRAMHENGLPEWVRVSVGTMDQNRRFLTDFDAVWPELSVRREVR